MAHDLHPSIHHRKDKTVISSLLHHLPLPQRANPPKIPFSLSLFLCNQNQWLSPPPNSPLPSPSLTPSHLHSPESRLFYLSNPPPPTALRPASAAPNPPPAAPMATSRRRTTSPSSGPTGPTRAHRSTSPFPPTRSRYPAIWLAGKHCPPPSRRSPPLAWRASWWRCGGGSSRGSRPWSTIGGPTWKSSTWLAGSGSRSGRSWRSTGPGLNPAIPAGLNRIDLLFLLFSC